MAETSIEWTERSWNPVVGCSVLSPGCTNCYAMAMAARLEAMGTAHYAGTTRATKAGQASSKHVWTGKLALAPDSVLLAPLRRRKATTWFVNSMGDLFHEDVPEEWIDRVFATMALGHQHTFQVLTKRGARMRAYLSDDRTRARIAEQTKAIQKARGITVYAVWCTDGLLDDPDPEMRPYWPLPNVWLGVSCEDQRRADERIPDLLATPAAIRFVSAEPLLGLLNIAQYLHDSVCRAFDGEVCTCSDPREVSLDWIIVGGESGQGARPMHPDWARQIRDQCAAAGTAFFFKQWGSWYPQIDRDSDDPDWRQDYSRRFADAGAYQWLNLAGGRGFHGERFHVMGRIGKAAAGRRLDGTLHDAMPEAAP